MKSNLVFELKIEIEIQLKFLNWNFLGKFYQIYRILGLTYYKSDYTPCRRCYRDKNKILLVPPCEASIISYHTEKKKFNRS